MDYFSADWPFIAQRLWSMLILACQHTVHWSNDNGLILMLCPKAELNPIEIPSP